MSNPGALTARNVVPEINSYRSLRDLVSYANALGTACVGLFWSVDDSGTFYTFAGTATGLFSLQTDGTWTDVTRTTGGAYTGVTNWEFAKFGERVLAVPTSTTSADTPQYFDMGTSTDFENLAGSPPNCRHIAVVRDFVMLGNLENASDTVQWAGFNSSELWTASASTQADSQQLFGRGGQVQRIVPGDVAVIFREHSIHMMQPVGPPLIFDNREVEKQRGTPAPNSVVWSGNLIFYYAHDGFYRFEPGGSVPIGANKVNRWFESEANPGAIETMQGAIDRRNRLVYWAFSAGGVNLDRVLIYNWAADRWSYGEIDLERIDEVASPGYTIDTINGILPGTMDDYPGIQIDSPDYQGGVLNFAGVDLAHTLGTFSGSALQGVVDTAEFTEAGFAEQIEDRRLLVKNVRPLVDGSDPTVTVQTGHRDTLGAGTTFDTAVAINDSGDANVFRDARYHRVRALVSGDYDHIQGVTVEAVPTGRQ